MDENKQQWLSIAAVVLVVGGLGYFLYKQSQVPVDEDINIDDIVAEEKADDLIESMNFEVPEDADRATLKDVSGGESIGVATRQESEEGGRTYSLLAALPDPSSGEFYEGYMMESGEDDEVYLGKLRKAKGGWLLEYEGQSSLLESNPKVVITLEKVDDETPETKVLEGAFN